jgi:hypothetical protein
MRHLLSIPQPHLPHVLYLVKAGVHGRLGLLREKAVPGGVPTTQHHRQQSDRSHGKISGNITYISTVTPAPPMQQRTTTVGSSSVIATLANPLIEKRYWWCEGRSEYEFRDCEDALFCS